VLSTDAQGKAVIDRRAVLDKRETELKLDTSKPFKLNAGTVGVCQCLFPFSFSLTHEQLSLFITDRVAYSPERLAKLGEQAAHRPSPFTLEDKMGLVNDALVLAKSGYSKTSGALNLIEKLQSEEECMCSYFSSPSHV
jgi:aminopeptidase 2